jgi:hypothetical protein
MTYKNVQTGLNLRVTLRPNVKTSQGWTYPLLDEYLDLIENNSDLKALSEEMQEQFVGKDGELFDSGEPVGDLVVVSRFLEGDLKEKYRLRKQELQCVNYFGYFLPPSNHMMLQDGRGNGLVVLDIDLKGLGAAIPEPYLELIEEDLIQYYSNHLCTAFLYQSSSALGYHIGYLTDAQTPTQYKVVFGQLVRDLQQRCPKVANLVDLGVGDNTRCFFTNHSTYVLRKTPEAIYRTNEAEAQLLEQQVHQLTFQEQVPYDEFPYQDDFRLYLAFQAKGEGYFFDDRRDWFAMMYALKTIYPSCYLSRMEHWFHTLSKLSPKFNPKVDNGTFQSILDAETAEKSGLDFIIKHLASGESSTRYAAYKREDVASYFASLNQMDKADTDKTNVLEIDQYITEIKEVLRLEDHQNLIIEAPPGTGKSTLVLEHITQKRVVLVPTLVLLQDLHKNVPKGVSLQVVQQDVQADDIVDAEVILCTYEGLGKVLDSRVDVQQYTLILDEAHNLFVSASPTFRFTTLNRILSSFYRFKNVILLSGTWIEYPFYNRSFTHYKVQKRNAEGPVLELVTTPNPLNSLAEETLTEHGKQIALINNREENWKLDRLIKSHREGALVTVMNRDTKGSEEVLQRLEYNSLREGEVLVGTQMITEGISFNDPDIKAIRFYQNLLPEHIIQLSYRARSSEARPIIKYYHSRQSFKLSALANYQYAYLKAKEGYEALNPAQLGRELIKDSQLLIYYQNQKGPQSPKVYTPYISGGTGFMPVHLNGLLLGYYALRDVSSSLNGDLFSLLALLRQRGFRFSFSTMGISSIREDFKQMEEILQKEMIRDKLQDIVSLPYEKLDHQQKDHIYKAWCLVQCVDAMYFLQKSEEDRVKLFTDKKSYQLLVETVLGSVMVEENTFKMLEQFASVKFKDQYAAVLSKIREVPGYPENIFHADLENAFKSMNLSIQAVKKILRQQYNLSDAKSTTREGVKDRVFDLTKRNHDFQYYLKPEVMTRYDSPF